MRPSLLPTALLLATATSALELPDISFQPFLSALPLTLEDYLPNASHAQTTPPPGDLRKRQYANTCPTSFINCANLGASNLCCSPNAVCSADYAGHVACCPSGAACSGTIGGVITAGTLNSDGVLAGGTATTGGSNAGGLVTTTTNFDAASTTTNGLVLATTQSTVGTAADSTATGTGGGFVLDGSSTVATPGGGVRAAEIPLVARAILRVLEYLPV